MRVRSGAALEERVHRRREHERVGGVVHTSPSQLPTHAPANCAMSDGTVAPGGVTFTSAGSGVSRAQSFAPAVAASRVVVRMTTVLPMVTRDRSLLSACRMFSRGLRSGPVFVCALHVGLPGMT
jgi:hypothetical protein